ncbi:MAG: hypothetical protein MMC23_008424 [Stictis urceolatum]|nr:hypothetical protein [Stictis urceolata]
MINATYEDLTAVGEDADSAIQLEGGGYLAFTSVYHELHCLKIMRWYLYKEEYYSHIAPGSKTDDDLRVHVGKNSVALPAWTSY